VVGSVGWFLEGAGGKEGSGVGGMDCKKPGAGYRVH